MGIQHSQQRSPNLHKSQIVGERTLLWAESPPKKGAPHNLRWAAHNPGSNRRKTNMCSISQSKSFPHIRKYHGIRQASTRSPHLILQSVKGRECNHETFSTILIDSDLRQWHSPGEEWRQLPVDKTHRNEFSNMITVGRAENNDLILPFPYISKFHAYIQLVEDSSYLLTDANSANGTFVNGEKLKPNVPAKLNNGSTVSFASGLDYLFQTADV
jgi:hypothetical protein